MFKIGEYNNLIVHEKVDAGLFLVANQESAMSEEAEKVLLPNAYVESGLKVGDAVRVFIYLDSEDRIIATNLTPRITLGKFSYLAVKEVNSFGAFLDMGLAKDLLVPYRQQAVEMLEGKSYVVHMYLDETTNRLIASSKLNRFLSNDNLNLMEGEEVDLLVLNKTELGYNVIVNQEHKGLVFHDAIFGDLSTGDEVKGFVKTIRADQKLDIILHQQGISTIEPNAQQILNYLKANQGSMSITDKSPPELIYATFQMSKKSFKKSLGSLYKKELIRLKKDTTELL